MDDQEREQVARIIGKLAELLDQVFLDVKADDERIPDLDGIEGIIDDALAQLEEPDDCQGAHGNGD